MNKVKMSNIVLNRKMLSQLSILDPQTFDKIQTLVIEKTDS
jgi:ribosomal protein L20